MIEIKRNGKVFCKIEDVCEGSKLSRQLMDHHYVILKFTTVEPVYFEIGDTVEIPDFGYFELTSAYFPKQGENGGYEYELQMDAYYMAWKNKICKYRPNYGANETSFKLTTTVGVHMNVVLGNLKALGLKHNGKDFTVDYTTYNKDAFDVEKRFLVSYDSISILDAITSIAEALECEWWIDGSIIYLGTCEMVGQVTFEQGVNVKTMSYSESKATYITRLYAFGSDKNIPKGYFTGNSSDVTTDGIATDYLMLPTQEEDEDGFVARDGYIENVNVVKNPAQAIEGVVMFDDEYPKVECAVSGIKTYDSTVKNDDGTTTTQTFWQVASSESFATNFEKAWIKEGLTLMIKFTSGALLGMEFEVSYKVIDSVNYFELVANDTYGRTLPDMYLCPKIGDKFFLYNWDATKITETDLIQKARLSLLKHAKTYYKKSMVSNANFDCEMDAEDFYNNGTYDYRPLGEQVKLINPIFADVDEKGNHYRNSRIIGMEIKLDIPYDAPIYIVGEKAAYSKLGQLEDKVDSITVNGIQIGSSGSEGGGVYVIGLDDSTPETDSNVYSARRVRYTYLSKINDDTADNIITFFKKQKFKKGFEIGEFEQYSISSDGNAILGDVVVDRIHDAASTPSERVIIGAQGFDLYIGDDGKSHLYLDDLIVRRRFFASSAEIRKISYSGGTTIFSNAGSTLAKVSAVFDSDGDCVAYKCYACADDGTTKTMNWWHVGMMALCQTFNVKAGKSENLQNRYYWRLVIGVGQETLEDGKLYDYVILSNKEKFLGSDSYVPTYTDKVIADGNEDMLVFGDYGIEVTTDGGMGSMAGVFFEQEGKDTDDGGNKIANRYFYGYEAIDGFAPDAPAAGDVIVQVGDQIRWKSRGNLIKVSTSTEDNATDNAPAISMYHNLGALYSTGKQDSDGNGIVSPWQWKTCTAVISPEMVKFNSNNFAWFSDDPDEIISPITVMYSIETSGMFRVGSDGKLYGDNTYSGNSDTRYVTATCYKSMGSSKEIVDKCWWEVSYNNLYVTTPYVGTTSVVMANGDVADAPAYITASCYTIAVSEDGTQMRGDTLLASVDIPVLRDGGKGDPGKDGAKITITSTSVSYAKSSDNAMPDKNDDSLWQGTMPSVDEGDWLWTRTVVLYSDKTRLISVSVSRIGKDGASVKIMSTEVLYKLTETSEQPSEFDTSFPTSLTKGWYLWTKTIVVYDDGNSTESLSVSRIGDDGKQGMPGANGKTTHFAYADAVLFGDDGTAEVVFGFSTSMQSTSAYIGTYDDESLDDSEDWKDYSWTKLKGEPGKPGTNGENGVSYAINFNKQKVQVGADTYDEHIYVYVTKSVGSNITTRLISNVDYDFDVLVDGKAADGLKSVLKVNGYIGRSAWPDATTFQVNLYGDDDVLLATGSYSYGEKGDKGDDGESGLEIVISPDTLVYDTNDDGLVTDYSQTAAIYCNKGGKRYTNVEYSRHGVLNCEATYSGGTIKITKIGTQTISYTDNGTSKSLSVSVTTGHVMMCVIDKETGLCYYPLLRFSVNVAKFTGSMVANNKKFQTQYTEISNKYDNLPLKSQDDLTQYTSTIEQTARKISLSVSEKAVNRRNLLVGSEFTRFDSDNMTSNGQTSACRLRTGDQVDGYNSCRIVSDSTSYSYNGVVFKNIAVNANTTYTLTTWAKRISESLGAGCVVIIHEKKNFDGTTVNQQSWVLLSDANDSSGNYIDAIDEWKQKSRSFTTQGTTRYINVIFCARTYGTFAVCKPILEEGDSFNGYSKSEKDYDYIGGNMIDNSRDLTVGGTLVGVAGVVVKALDDEYAITNISASGSGSVGAFSIKKTLKAGVDYVLSWYIRRTSSDENGQCTVNLGRKILYSELHTGYQSVYSVEGGNTAHSGYQYISPVSMGWTRMWVHFRLSEDWTDSDNQFYIQLYKGTADSITAQLSRPKLEEGAYPTEWTDNPKTFVEEGSIANKLYDTGVDIVNKKVTVTADNFTVRNNSGVETMMVTKEGKLNASLVQAQQLETLGTNGQKIVIEDGLLCVIGLAGVANWRFGLDSNNRSVLSYYDDNGNKLYDLGPDGLTKIEIEKGTFTSGSYVNATEIGLSVSSYNSLYTTTHTSTSATGDVSVAETLLSNTSDDTALFKNVSASKAIGEQFIKTTLYQYRAPRTNGVVQADTDNNLNTQDLARQADGKYFTSRNISTGSSLKNLVSGCFFNAASKITNQSKFIIAGLGQFDSISLSLYAIQSPVSITNGAKSLGLIGQIKSRERYTQIGSAGNSVAPID